jgi:hypothetical protein
MIYPQRMMRNHKLLSLSYLNDANNAPLPWKVLHPCLFLLTLWRGARATLINGRYISSINNDTALLPAARQPGGNFYPFLRQNEK